MYDDNTMDQLPSILFDWLGKYAFEDLSPEQQTVVLEHISKQEYQDMHGSMPPFAFENSVLASRVQSSIPSKKPSVLHRIARYPIPLYQVAASFALIFGSVFLFKQWQKESVEPEVHSVLVDQNISIEKGYYPKEMLFEF